MMGVCKVTLCPCVREETRTRGTPRVADCQRCHIDGPAVYRLHTRDMDLMVCERCADVAEQLGLSVS